MRFSERSTRRISARAFASITSVVSPTAPMDRIRASVAREKSTSSGARPPFICSTSSGAHAGSGARSLTSGNRCGRRSSTCAATSVSSPRARPYSRRISAKDSSGTRRPTWGVGPERHGVVAASENIPPPQPPVASPTNATPSAKVRRTPWADHHGRATPVASSNCWARHDGVSVCTGSSACNERAAIRERIYRGSRSHRRPAFTRWPGTSGNRPRGMPSLDAACYTGPHAGA